MSITIDTQGKNHSSTVSGGTQVTQFARLIVQQGDISTIKEIPNLPDHQKNAKKQSTDWLHKYWPLVIATTSEIIDYANTFQTTYEYLVPLLPKLKKGDEEAKKEFIAALSGEGGLLPTLQAKQKASQDRANDIYKFSSSFDELYHSFQNDFEAANKVLTHDNSEIIKKQAEATKYHLEANAYVTSAVGAAVAIPATATCIAFFAPTGVGLILGGIIMIGEVAAIATLLALYVETMNKYSDAMQELNHLNQEVAQLTAIEKQITGLQDSSQSISTSASNYADGWVALSDELKGTIQHLEKSKPEEAAITIEINLSTANKDWGNVLEQAKKLQPDGGQLDSKTFKTSEDMIKAMGHGS